MKKKVINKTVIELDWESLKNVLIDFYNAPPEASISFSGAVVDDEREPNIVYSPKMAKFTKIKISYNNE